jgi:hypothetical protein
LIFLNVVNQLVLFAAALTAAGTVGQVSDRASRPTATAPPRPRRAWVDDPATVSCRH